MAISNISKNLFSRSFGGTTEPHVLDPYISGYAFIWFNRLPAKVNGNYAGSNPAVFLPALAVGVTLPTFDLNKTTIRGMGGTKWSVPTDFASGDSVSIRYIELSGLPITNFHHKWVNMIRDIRHGASNLEGNAYTKTGYTADLYYWTTKPDGITPEFMVYLTGLFPQRSPLDSHNFDVNTVDRVEIEIAYNVDNIYIYSEDQIAGNSFIKAKVQTWMNTLKSFKNTIKSWAAP